MARERLKFIDLYKFAGAVIIACFLHYNTILLAGLGLGFDTRSKGVAFLMCNKTNSVVELFFVMSGFVFAFAYTKKIAQQKLSFAEFFDARLRRLLPLVFVTTPVMFVLQILCGKLTNSYFYPGNYSPNGFVSLNDFVSSMLLCNSSMVQSRVNSPAWYVADLLLCYVLAWGLAKVRMHLGKITFLIPVIAGVIIQNMNIDIPLFNYNFSRSYIAFFIGLILGNVLTDISTDVRNWKFFGGGGAAVCIAAVFILRNYVTDRSLIVSTMLFPQFILLGYSSPVLNKLCDCRIIRKLGEVSFDIYLWNFPVLVFFYILYHVRQFSINSYGWWGLISFINVAVGFLSAEARRMIGQRIKL